MRENSTSSIPFYEELPAFFSRLESQDRVRTLREPQGLDLCSNDYLGLSKHPEIIQSLKEGIDLYGAGSTASRLVRGHRSIFQKLEEEFSSWVGSEGSLFLANGYTANVGAISSICDPSYVVFADRNNHASLMDGVRLSGAKKVYYHHQDFDHLEELLKKYSSSKHKMIVTESLFSMDGDVTDVEGLLNLKERYGTLLYLDEAHSIGVWGKKGAGVSHMKVPEERISQIDFRMSTLGKALGLEGALVSCSESSREYLLHCARTFVFSTAPIPAIAHAGMTAIRLAQSMDSERSTIERNSDDLRRELRERGYSTGSSNSQIVPILMQSEKDSLLFASRLLDAGFEAKAIRPPTVTQSRIRVSIHAGITPEQLKSFIEHFPRL
ncbi:8-amino-7-oxononanoate synthase [Leptospira perolatii]|uniref:8-amino-7-oxononanoate synthase n=1 Tax=Leptospira perolatii TaxID=2023191 RepID=A0A2M9ZJX3_9LEPT|nr:8-amino-7-oxononanoate synthase [Leptospira perolatii]PJZ68588.1 8-amino-7-oxononanoate synthase [Leptospira perolatii]PJZ72243.1 8-amino-7-oxononanoate synthase [Leptospira perolatii]